VHAGLDRQCLSVLLAGGLEQSVGGIAAPRLRLSRQRYAPVVERFMVVRLNRQRLSEFLAGGPEQRIGDFTNLRLRLIG
jgi:hypothetical protein